jgi:hypothetical protein
VFREGVGQERYLETYREVTYSRQRGKHWPMPRGVHLWCVLENLGGSV